jgi:hypothetical protein
MLAPSIPSLSLLLEVFRDGLRLGIISKQEVIAWADNIISEYDDPDYLFIELSLSNDKSKLIDVLNEYVVTSNSPICARVLLGRIYEHLIAIDDISKVEDIAALVGKVDSIRITLTGFECNKIFVFGDYEMFYLPDTTQLQVELICFLNIYKPFTLENYDQWHEINSQVLAVLKEEEAKEDIINASIRKSFKQRERKRKLKNFLIGSLSIIISIVVFLMIIMMVNIILPERSSYAPHNNSWGTSTVVVFIYFLFKVVNYLLKRGMKNA